MVDKNLHVSLQPCRMENRSRFLQCPTLHQLSQQQLWLYLWLVPQQLEHIQAQHTLVRVLWR